MEFQSETVLPEKYSNKGSSDLAKPYKNIQSNREFIVEGTNTEICGPPVAPIRSEGTGYIIDKHKEYHCDR